MREFKTKSINSCYIKNVIIILYHVFVSLKLSVSIKNLRRIGTFLITAVTHTSLVKIRQKIFIFLEIIKKGIFIILIK